MIQQRVVCFGSFDKATPTNLLDVVIPVQTFLNSLNSSIFNLRGKVVDDNNEIHKFDTLSCLQE